MPLIDNHGDVACATCPRILKKAKKRAEEKRFEQKENLTKMHYISSHSVSSDTKATSLGRDKETGTEKAIQLTEVGVSQMNGIFLVDDDPIRHSDYEQEMAETTVRVLYDDEIVHQSKITFSAGTSESVHSPLDLIAEVNCVDLDNEAPGTQSDAEVKIGEVTKMNYNISYSLSSDATSNSLNRDDEIGTSKDMDVSQTNCIFRVNDNPISHSYYEKEMADTTVFDYNDDDVSSAESSEALEEVNSALETHIDEGIETGAINCKSGQPDNVFCDNREEEVRCYDEINIETVIVTGQNEAKKSRQNQAKERFENQMKAYLAISDSYERSVGLSYNSSEEDNLSSANDTLDERPTSSQDSVEFIETQTEEKKILAMPYHAENEETLDNDSDEHESLDAPKTNQIQDVMYATEELDVIRKSSQDATDIDSYLHAYQIDNQMSNKELCQPAGDGELDMSVGEIKISRGTQDDASMPPTSPLLSFSPTLKRNHRPSFHITTDPFQNENLIPTTFEAKNSLARNEDDFWGSGVNEINDSQPIVSMSYSIPGVTDKSERRVFNSETPVTYKEVDPFKDTTNEMSSMNNTFRNRPQRRRPCPESIGGSSVRPRKKEVRKIPKSENPLPMEGKKKVAPMESQDNCHYQTKEDQEHLIDLFHKLNTVATRLSALEVISIKQGVKSETNTVTVDHSSSVTTNSPVKDHDLMSKDFARMIEEVKRSIGMQEDGDVIDKGMDNLFERLNMVSLEMKELDKSIERLKTK